MAVFGLGGIGLSCIQGAVMAKAGRIIAVDINPDKWAIAKALGATDFINPKTLSGSVTEAIIEMTNGGVDYSFECIGNVHVMREALECCHMGWGVSTIIGVAGAGQEISTRPSSWSQGVPGKAPPSVASRGAPNCRATLTAT